MGMSERGGILELGCGEGTLFRYLAERFQNAYVGVDISEVALSSARRHTTGEYHCGTLESFVPSRNFDAIVFGEVLYYVSDPEQIKVVERYQTGGV